MKGMKKLLSILMVLTLVLSLGATAFAATVIVPASNVENEDPDVVHTYEAYQIFKGEQDASKGDDAELGNVEWGDGVDSANLLKALKADPTIGKYFADKEDGTKVETAKDVAEAMKSFTDNSAEAEAFAALVEANIVAGKGKALSSGENELEDGYYLIVDTTSVAGEQTAKNRSMLQMTGTINITQKYDIPKSEKKVKDINDSESVDMTDWQDAADWDIGDVVPFKLSATIPANTAVGYKTYELIYHDEQCEGLTFDEGSVKVYLNGTLVADTSKYSVVTEGLDDDCTFHVVFADILTVEGFEVGVENVITVEYNATLNDKAVIGPTGNPNEYTLEFSNDSRTGGTGKTPEDKVIVFTYDLDTNKIDGETKEALKGADFALYKQVVDSYGASGVGYLNTKTGEFKSAIPEGAEAADWVKCVPVELTKNAEGDDATVFHGKGVDDGVYWIVETKTPAGYNSIDPFKFEISAEHHDGDEPALDSVTGDENYTFTLKPEEGKAMGQGDVINEHGVTLPETGGIGTTIFYIAGAILVAGAVILLVTKKRVNGMEK